MLSFCRHDMAGKNKGSNSLKRKGGKTSLFSLIRTLTKKAFAT